MGEKGTEEATASPAQVPPKMNPVKNYVLEDYTRLYYERLNSLEFNKSNSQSKNTNKV